jgi:hypothetical protein
MQGRQVEYRPGFPGAWAQPGDYCKVPRGLDPREDGCWYAMDPTGGIGTILPSIHRIVENDDGTISLSPSLVMPGGWHGFLERGLWRSV